MALLKIIHLTAFLRPQSGVYKICMAFKEFKKFNLPPFSHTSPWEMKAILMKWLKGTVCLHQGSLTLILLK